MQCSTTSELDSYASSTLPPNTRVCERPPERIETSDVFLNALHDAMPECDRVTHAATLTDLAERDGARHCYVYCAQRSCHAAVDFMTQHADELHDACDTVTYLRNGALAMSEAELVDGARCHANIVKHNAVEETGCLNCDTTQETRIDLSLDGESRPNATYLGTRPSPPDWFKRVSVWSRLPPQFSRDPRYAHPPQTHDPKGSVQVRLDTTGMGVRDDALLAYWASKPDDGVREAHVAYDDFTNSGIVQCHRRTCDFTIDFPGAYTEEGRVFRPHFHVSEWKGDHWGGVGTVTLGTQ